MPNEYQQDYKKTRAYAPKIYNDPNMSGELRDIYMTLESRYVHKGRTIDPSFYNDLSDDSVAKFTAIGICIYSDTWGLDELEKTIEQIKPYNSRLLAIDDIQNLIHQRTIHKRPPSDNGDLPSTKLSPRSYSRALKDDPTMSKEQRETRGTFKNLGRALHNFARMLKKGRC
ncbi:hypothetical protein Tco_1053947 [Tanacetum coccineum]|uniref:Uncharacterized protein n=1 Tax=Tanacetum coccineum TaxID=301880 RepID=A0ABQ5GWY7_9ASTR